MAFNQIPELIAPLTVWQHAGINPAEGGLNRPTLIRQAAVADVGPTDRWRCGYRSFRPHNDIRACEKGHGWSPRTTAGVLHGRREHPPIIPKVHTHIGSGRLSRSKVYLPDAPGLQGGSHQAG